MKAIIIILLAIILSSCVSTRYREAYERGEITAAQMLAFEQVERQQIANAFNEMGASFQRQQIINNMNRPQTVYVYPMR
jgi:PBP1b-binding outer membrane lipoprotein LpoB